MEKINRKTISMISHKKQFTLLASLVILASLVVLSIVFYGKSQSPKLASIRSNSPIGNNSPQNPALTKVKQEFAQNEVLVKLVPGKNAETIAQSLVSLNNGKTPSVESVFQPGTDGRLESRFTASKKQNRTPPNATLPSGLERWWKVKLDTNSAEAVLKEIKKRPDVEAAQLNYQVTTTLIPNDPYYHSQGSWGQPPGSGDYDDLWALKSPKLNMEPAWDISQGAGVVVAVVDTGVDYNHADIANQLWRNTLEIPQNGIDDDGNGYIDDVNGWDFAYQDNDPADAIGHGTHVSGTIAAEGNNAEGIIGVAPQAEIMNLKAFNDAGFSTSDILAEAIVYGVENGARVMNNSWGCGWCMTNPLVEEAVRAAYSTGVVIVMAAGNSGANDVALRSPQNQRETITVAGTDENDERFYFSSFGWLLEASAPGGGSKDRDGWGKGALVWNILSLLGKGSSYEQEAENIVGGSYFRIAGTSMAAAHASGLAALILATHPAFTNEDVRQVLMSSADDVMDGGFDYQTGAGRLNAVNALTVNKVARAIITAPRAGTEISRALAPAGAVLLNITGTAAGDNFDSYEIWIAEAAGKGNSVDWQLVQRSSQQVQDGLLASVNINSLPDGLYLIRLNIILTTGGLFQDFTYIIKEPSLIRRISPDDKWQDRPEIDGNRVIWRDLKNNNPYSSDIYLFDISSGAMRQITSDQKNHQSPRISGNYIVWLEQNAATASKDVYLYDITTGEKVVIVEDPLSQWSVDIFGNTIVWAADEERSMYACSYDAATKSCPSRRLDAPAIVGIPPRIYDNFVAHGTEIGTVLFGLYDLNTNIDYPVSGQMGDSTNRRIEIYQNLIIWPNNVEYYADSLYGCLFVRATGTCKGGEQLLLSGIYHLRNARIFGENVVFEHGDLYSGDISIYNLRTKELRHIASHPAGQFEPAMSDKYVVWADWRSLQRSNIFLYKY